MDHAGAELRDLAVAGSVLALSLLIALPCMRAVRPSAGPNEHQRDRYLDGLRGLAAIAVMASHFGGNITYALGAGPATPLFHNLGTAGVQVFFALTGYLFTRKAVAARGQLALGPFFLARVRRIVPMYTVAILAGIVLVCVVTWREPVALGRLARQAVSLYAFGFVLDGSPQIKGVPYVEVLGAIWSLPFEWGFYLFMPVLAAMVTSWRWLAVGGAVLAVYFGALMTDGRGDVFSPFFLPGVLLGLAAPHLAASPRTHRWCAAAALLLLVAAVLPGTQNFTPSRLLLMTGLFAALVAGRPAVLSARPVAFLGDISYSIYLMHFPVLFATQSALRSLDPSGAAPLTWAAAFLVASGAVVALSAVTYRWVELPFLRRRPALAPAAVPALV